MNRIGVILLFYFLSVSCGHNENKTLIREGGEGERVVINPEKIVKDYAMASVFVDSIEYIPLETSHEGLVGRIKAIYEWKGRFYIWDEQSDAIFIFSERGDFLKKIAAKGRGPKEYIAINLFYQNYRNGDLYIRCDRSMSILQYDAEGVFIKRIPCDFITMDFVLLGEDSLVLYGGKMPNQKVFQKTFPEQWRLVMMKDEKLLQKKFPGIFRDVFLNDVAKSRSFSCFSDSILLMETVGNDIYRLYPDGEVKPRFIIDFGKYNYPLTFDKSKDEALEIINSMRQGRSKWCKVIDIWETESNLLIEYSFEGYMFYAIYSKTNRKTYPIGPVWVNDIDGVAMPAVCASGKDYFLGVLEAHVILNAVESANKPSDRIKKMAEGLTEMDNPVLVRIKMKKI